MKKSDAKKITFSTKTIAMAGVIAALYAALTYLQNYLIPGSASMAVQFRVSEALNVLALFTPAAIPGLTIGCIIANIGSIGQGLPLDMIFGSIATFLAATCMYLLRNVKFKNHPFLATLIPTFLFGIVVGWEAENFVLKGKFILSPFMIFAFAVTLLSTICLYLLKNAKVNKYPFLAMLMPAIFNGLIIGWQIETFYIEGKFHYESFLLQGGFVALGEVAVMFVLGTALYYAIVNRNLDKNLK